MFYLYGFEYLIHLIFYTNGSYSLNTTVNYELLKEQGITEASCWVLLLPRNNNNENGHLQSQNITLYVYYTSTITIQSRTCCMMKK